MGPTAQDFLVAFGFGNDETSIATVDADGITMLAIQALEQRSRQLQAEVERVRDLQTELRSLRAELTELPGLREELAELRKLLAERDSPRPVARR